MDRIGLNIQVEDFHSLLSLTEFMDRLLGIVCHLFFEDSMAIFWTEHDVLLALVQ